MKKKVKIIEVFDLDISFPKKKIIFDGVFLNNEKNTDIDLKVSRIKKDLLVELEFEIFGPDFEVQGKPYCVKAVKLMPVCQIIKNGVGISFNSFANSGSTDEVVMAGIAEYLVTNGELEISKIGEENEGTEEIVFSFKINDFITEGRCDFNQIKNVFTEA